MILFAYIVEEFVGLAHCLPAFTLVVELIKFILFRSPFIFVFFEALLIVLILLKPLQQLFGTVSIIRPCPKICACEQIINEISILIVITALRLFNLHRQILLEFRPSSSQLDS